MNERSELLLGWRQVAEIFCGGHLPLENFTLGSAYVANRLRELRGQPIANSLVNNINCARAGVYAGIRAEREMSSPQFDRESKESKDARRQAHMDYLLLSPSSDAFISDILDEAFETILQCGISEEKMPPKEAEALRTRITERMTLRLQACRPH